MLVLLLMWFWTAAWRGVRLVYGAGRARAALLAAGLLVAAWIPASVLPTPRLWDVVVSSDAEAAERAGERLDTERVYHAQRQLLADSLAKLAPQRPGVPDLYFLGFAGTSTQDVFFKEARSAQELFDDRFDTRRRSLLLVNNPHTVDTLPIASVSNLRRALDGIAKKMNPDEDVLFLFLTSHGSPHVFSVSFPELALDSLTDRALKQMLDHSGIKWRVIVISACYSGSFIDALKNDHTLIMTAAAKDRTSFGCSSENDFTYFGDAYINQALRHQRSFTAAFAEARRTIAEREQQEKLTPSKPQISLGAAIKAKLERLQQRLDRRAMAAVQ